MYLPQPKYSKHIIKDLYTVYLPPPPKRQEIQGWERKKEDQYWRRTPLPSWWEERRAEEKEIQDQELQLCKEGELDRVKHFDPICEQYRRQEWHRRIHGHWFMNNGVPTYLTGTHYVYLQWTKGDHSDNDGYPIFYHPQLNRFYFRQLCVEDPFSLGYILVGSRGFGKSFEESACVMESITKPPHNRHAIIQSKTGDDAKTVIFKEKMILIFNSYPDFYQPAHSHGTDPDKGFFFKRKSDRVEGHKKLTGPNWELGNTLKHYNAKEKAVDGKTAAEILVSEIGKTHPTLEADAFIRHVVHTKCVFRNNKKTGIIREETTVEEMEEGGEQCFQIWKGSNPLIRDANGYTESKVYKYLVSGLETATQFADKYGFIDEVKAYKYIMNERELVKHDPIKLAQVTRKTPLNEDEAFMKDQSKCMFNVFILKDVMNKLRETKKPWGDGRPGRLGWVRGIVDGDVEWIDDETNYDFVIYYALDAMRGKRKLLNNCDHTFDDGKKLWLPCNNDILRAGLDPIRYVKTDDPRASKQAAHGFILFDNMEKDLPIEEWYSHNLAWEYFFRHEDPENDFENMIKALRYWGMSIQPENNQTDFSKHMKSRGYDKFKITRRNFTAEVLSNKWTKNSLSQDEAISSFSEVINSYTKEIIQFVNRHGRRIKSLRLAQQLMDFDPKAPTKTDLVVSFGYTLLACKAILEDLSLEKAGVELDNFFTKYDISGRHSVALQQPELEYDSGSDEGDEDDKGTTPPESDIFNNPDMLDRVLNS